MDAPEEARARFLRAAREEFEADLEATFGDRFAQFSPQLRTHLLELWARARKRPAVPNDDLEVARLETRFRELLWRELDDAMLVDRLVAVLEPGSNVRLEQLDHRLRLETQGLEIPELAVGGPDDEFQVALRKRLAVEGLVPDPAGASFEWVPARINEKSGTLVGMGYRGRCLLEPRRIDTLLHEDVKGTWVFPRPRPKWEGAQCEHVQLRVDDGEPELNAGLAWTADGDEVESVSGLIATSDSSVRAVYVVMKTVWL